MAKSKSKSGRSPELLRPAPARVRGGPSDGPSIRAYFNGQCSSFNRLMKGRNTPAEGESVLLFFTRYSENRTLTEFYLADQETADPDARVGALVALNAAYRMAGQLVEREAAFYGVPVIPFVAMRRATLEAWKNPRRVNESLVADVTDPPGYQDALAELSAKLAAAKLTATSTPASAPGAAGKGATTGELPSPPEDRCHGMHKTEIAARILHKTDVKKARAREAKTKMEKCGLRDEGDGKWTIRLIRRSCRPERLSAYGCRNGPRRLRLGQPNPPPRATHSQSSHIAPTAIYCPILVAHHRR